jgi:hypothetical protein
MDVSQAGQMAALQMENIERDYEGMDGCEIGLMINIVQVVRADGTLDNRVRYTAPAPFMALGLMRVAEEVILRGDSVEGD